MVIKNDKDEGEAAVDMEFALSNEQIDAIGEILNISMGSAATAISTMLDKQVIITTPKVSVVDVGDIDYTTLEPAMLVKIEYIQGISGSNVMVFRQSDMQIVLNLLMGNDEPPAEDFVFDEMSMSAACEVMNQMMGASATALSEFLGKTINISTPTATILDSDNTFRKAISVNENQNIVAVAFTLDIMGVMNSEFISIMPICLAKMIISQAMEKSQDAVDAKDKKNQKEEQAHPVQESALPHNEQAARQPYMSPPPLQAPAEQQIPTGQQPPSAGQQAPMGQQAYMPYPPYYPNMPFYPPMPDAFSMQQMLQMQQNGQQPSGGVMKQAVNVQNAQFPSFVDQLNAAAGIPLTKTNMDLVMNVPLNISVEIGKTKRKIKDIMDFTKGTVIELEKQAGAPVDIVVNGQLIARGDVVVIDDNFGVRITEIVNTKELMETIGNDQS